jgi:hypothetical protein
MSSDHIISELRKEQARLREELQRSVVYQQMMAIEGLLALYGLSPQTDARPAADAPPIPKTRPSRDGTVAAGVIAAARQHLQSVHRRAMTKEIVEAVLKSGVLAESRNPYAAVSSYISTAKDVFDNMKGQGYGLVEWREGSASGTPITIDHPRSEETETAPAEKVDAV